MANPKLLEYIRQALSKGFSISDIKTKLMNVGWKPDDIDSAIKEMSTPDSVISNGGQASSTIKRKYWIGGIILGIITIILVSIFVQRNFINTKEDETQIEADNQNNISELQNQLKNADMNSVQVIKTLSGELQILNGFDGEYISYYAELLAPSRNNPKMNERGLHILNIRSGVDKIVAKSSEKLSHFVDDGKVFWTDVSNSPCDIITELNALGQYTPETGCTINRNVLGYDIRTGENITVANTTNDERVIAAHDGILAYKECLIPVNKTYVGEICNDGIVYIYNISSGKTKALMRETAVISNSKGYPEQIFEQGEFFDFSNDYYAADNRSHTLLFPMDRELGWGTARKGYGVMSGGYLLLLNSGAAYDSIAYMAPGNIDNTIIFVGSINPDIERAMPISGNSNKYFIYKYNHSLYAYDLAGVRGIKVDDDVYWPKVYDDTAIYLKMDHAIASKETAFLYIVRLSKNNDDWVQYSKTGVWP
jgi:hypothetical protein